MKQLASTYMLGMYPACKSVTWFEHFKDGQDFRIIIGQSRDA